MPEEKNAEANDDEARPPFAATFPREAALDALVDAFARGNFATVRTGVPKLVASTEDEAVKRAAASLLARTKPDPLAALLIALSAVLLVALSAWWIAHSGKG